MIFELNKKETIFFYLQIWFSVLSILTTLQNIMQQKILLILFLLPSFVFGQGSHDYLDIYTKASHAYDAYRYSEALLMYNELIFREDLWKNFTIKKKAEIYQKAINSHLKKSPNFNQNNFNQAITLANQSVKMIGGIANKEDLGQYFTEYYINISFAIAKYDINSALGYLLIGAKQSKDSKYAQVLLGKVDDLLLDSKNTFKDKQGIIEKIEKSIQIRKEKNITSFAGFLSLGIACFQKDFNTLALLAYQEAMIVSKDPSNVNKVMRTYYLKNLPKVPEKKQFELTKEAILAVHRVGKLSVETTIMLGDYFNNSYQFKDESLFFYQLSFELAENVDSIKDLFTKGKTKGEYLKLISRTDNAFQFAKVDIEVMEENGLKDINIYKALVKIFKEKGNKEAYIFFSEKRLAFQFEQKVEVKGSLKQLALTYFQDKNYHKAKEKLHDLLEHDGKHAITYHWLIKCNMQLNEIERANDNLGQMVRTKDFVKYYPKVRLEWNKILDFLGVKDEETLSDDSFN